MTIGLAIAIIAPVVLCILEALTGIALVNSVSLMLLQIISVAVPVCLMRASRFR